MIECQKKKNDYTNWLITRSTDDTELKHHGVKGMKWGVRRYQNKDGSLTAAGRSRYSGPGESSNDDWVSKEYGLGNKLSEKERKKYFNKDGSITKDGVADLLKGKQYKNKTSGNLTEDAVKRLGFAKNVKSVYIDDDGSLLLKEKDSPIPDDDSLGRKIVPNKQSQGYKDHVAQVAERKKLSIEQSNKQFRELTDELNTGRPGNRGDKLYREINKYICDFSNSYYASNTMKKLIKQGQKVYDSTRTAKIPDRIAARKASVKEVCGQILKELGFKDTEESRQLMYDNYFY